MWCVKGAGDRDVGEVSVVGGVGWGLAEEGFSGLMNEIVALKGWGNLGKWYVGVVGGEDMGLKGVQLLDEIVGGG